MKHPSEDKFVVVKPEAFAPMNEVQKRLHAILEYWGPDGAMWIADFGECGLSSPRCALGVIDGMFGDFSITRECELLDKAATEMGHDGETGNHPAADCNDSGFENARAMVLRAIELAA